MPLTGPRQDSNQILPNIYDPTHNAIQVELVGDSIALDINSATDSIAIATSAGVPLAINADGSLNVNIEGLSTFQTSQYTVGTSAVELTPTPMTDRRSISIKAITVSGNIIYIGNSAAVTIATGYPLFNDDVLNMDLTPADTIYAIASAAGQTICVLEIGD